MPQYPRYGLVVIVLVAWTLQLATTAARADCPTGIDSSASRSLSERPSLTSGCHTGIRNEIPLPDPRCTPGAVNPTLTLNVLEDRDFRTGCVRDNATTAEQKAGTYSSYAIPHPSDNKGAMQTCELDHLISLELGGADTLDNIWPQCGPPGVALSQRYFKQKDMVENYLAMRVRNGELDLSEAQQGIAADWTQYLNEAEEACKMGKCR